MRTFSWAFSAISLAYVVCWSSGFVGAELGTRLTGADTLLMWRFLAASLVLVVLCVLTRRRITRQALKRHVCLGVLMQLGYLGAVVLGVQPGVPAAIVALIAALQPIVVALLTAVLLGERFTVVQMLGLAVGFAGVALVVGDGLQLGGVSAWVYLLPVVGMVLLSVGTMLGQRTRDPADLLTGLTIQTVTAATGFTIAAMLTGNPMPPLTVDFAAAVAWVVVLSGFGGYGCYLLVLARAGATRVSVLLYLTPPTTLVWTALMFGQPIRAAAVTGMALSAGGVALFLAAGRERAHKRSSPALVARSPHPCS